MKKITGYVIVSLGLVFGGVWVAAQVDLTTFEAGDVIRAEEVNANFEALRSAVSSVVLSLNGQRGAIALEAGPNISIDDSEEGRIVIAASGGDAGGGDGGGDITAVVAGSGLTGGGEAGAVTLAAADDLARDAEIVPTVLANDGSGSGLDADTLDGLDGSDLAAADHTHDALPEAIGKVRDFPDNPDPPAIQGGTGNFTLVFNDTYDRYEITISDFYFSINDVAVVTPAGSAPMHLSVSSVGGKLLIYIFDEAGAPTRRGFNFTAYAF